MGYSLADLATVLRNAVLAPHLGQYVHRYNAALNKPAISVGARSEPGYDVTGIEAVIERHPRDRSAPLLGDGIHVHREWVVLLKDWGGNGLAAAVTSMQLAFPQLPSPVYVPETDETIATVEFRIPEELHLGGSP